MGLPPALLGSMRSISQSQIDTLLQQAAASERQRAILRLHEHEEPVQRMVNALHPGTYITPHKHEAPDKVELFNILVGRLAVLQFDAMGEVTHVIVLAANGPTRIVDIAPRTYHTLIPLEPAAALEIIQGPYDAATHKQFAPWAPLENTSEAPSYLQHLQAIVANWG